MTDKRRNIASKIQKLMTLAERGEGNEAEAAAEVAARLMREHAISMASLRETELLETDPLEGVAFEVGTSTWKVRLAWALATHCQVSAVRSVRYTGTHPTQVDDNGRSVPLKGGHKRHVFAWGYGHRSDLEVWEYLYTVGVRQIEAEARRYKAKLEAEGAIPSELMPYRGKWFDVDGHVMSKRKALNRFRAGAVVGLNDKLYEQRKQEAAEYEGSTALVLQTRAKRAREEMERNCPNLGSGTQRGVWGSSAGVDAGRSISINKGVAAGRGQRMLEG